MSGLENLKTRLQYNGGNAQVGRMNKAKLDSLKKALLYSYQSATAILADGREFRCLINPDKIKNEYDNKVISIPFEDICLNEFENSSQDKNKTSEGIQKIGIKAGDVFTWKENNTDWIVYLQRYEETAYFRADIRRCRYETEINGIKYKIFAAKPSNDNIDWRKIKNTTYNTLDYSMNMYITRDKNTEGYLHRFSIIKINDKPWEVQAVDLSSDGIIIVALKEYFSNTIQDRLEEQQSAKEEDASIEENEKIEGPIEVYPYEIYSYTVNADGGNWVIGSSKVKILSQDDQNLKINIISGRSGKFEIKYIRENKEDIVLNVTIKSL